MYLRSFVFTDSSSEIMDKVLLTQMFSIVLQSHHSCKKKFEFSLRKGTTKRNKQEFVMRWGHIKAYQDHLTLC